MKRDLIWRQAVNPPFCLSDQAECTYCSLPYPGGEIGAFHQLDQITYFPVRLVLMWVTVVPGLLIGPMMVSMVVMRMIYDWRWFLLEPAWKHHVHFRSADSAAIHRLDVHMDVRKAQPAGNTA